MTIDRHPLESFFSPRSIVVYGATNDIDKPGGRIFTLLRRYGRPVYAIHSSQDSVDGYPIHRSASELRETPDLAVLAVNSRHSEEALRDALQAGVKAAILVASGFGETGPAGLEAEQRLVSMARERGARLLGPNTLGIFVPRTGLDTIFVELRPVAARFSRRQPQHRPVLIKLVGQAINPAKTQRFFDNVIIRDIPISTMLLKCDQPNTFLAGVVLLQPRPPLAATFYLNAFAAICHCTSL